MALDPKEIVSIAHRAIANGAGRDVMRDAYEWTAKRSRKFARDALRRQLCTHETAPLVLCDGPPLNDASTVACSVCLAAVKMPTEAIAAASVECNP